VLRESFSPPVPVGRAGRTGRRRWMRRERSRCVMSFPFLSLPFFAHFGFHRSSTPSRLSLNLARSSFLSELSTPATSTSPRHPTTSVSFLPVPFFPSFSSIPAPADRERHRRVQEGPRSHRRLLQRQTRRRPFPPQAHVLPLDCPSSWASQGRLADGQGQARKDWIGFCHCTLHRFALCLPFPTLY
jgi:hypothetical protein